MGSPMLVKVNTIQSGDREEGKSWDSSYIGILLVVHYTVSRVFLGWKE